VQKVTAGKGTLEMGNPVEVTVVKTGLVFQSS